MGQNNDFLQKSGLKTAFLSITILDYPTSDWAGSQNFKGIANFNMCFEKYRMSASKWAMGKASDFNIVRLAATWFFFCRVSPKNAKNVFFCFSANYLRFCNCKKIQGTTMSKLTSWRFQKCGTYRVWEFWNGSYRCSKLTDCEILGPLPKIRQCKKK